MSQFLVCAVPASFWDGARPRATPPTEDELFRELVLEASAVRRRVAAGVNQESERNRLNACLSRIEAEVLRRTADSEAVRGSWDELSLRRVLALGRLPALELDDAYLHMLALVEIARAAARTPGVPVPDDPLALGASLYRAEDLERHLRAASAEIAKVPDLPLSALAAHDRRAEFLGLVRAVGGCGVVEVQTVLDNRGIAAPPARPVPPPRPEPEPIAYPEPDPEAARDLTRRQEMVNRLHAEVEVAVNQAVKGRDGRGGKINASSQPHEVTTDVLGHWVRRPWPEADGPPPSVRVVYSDASEAAPFPLCRLSGREPIPPGRVLKFALMSMRHLDLDRVVNLAWYRNREVSQSRALADSDAYCFAYSLAQLKELSGLAAGGRTVTIRMYHTGFEPASLGFYRAIAAVLAADERFGAGWAAPLGRWLTVVPHYFQGGTRYTPSLDRDGTPLVWS